jgi:hypothetical protein
MIESSFGVAKMIYRRYILPSTIRGVADLWDEFLCEGGAERPPHTKIHPLIKQCPIRLSHRLR